MECHLTSPEVAYEHGAVPHLGSPPQVQNAMIEYGIEIDDLEDEELSILEYARRFSLTRDFSCSDPVSRFCARSRPGTLEEDPDPSNTTLPDLKQVAQSSGEVWHINQQVAQYLHDIASMHQHESLSASRIGRRCFKQLKIPRPLLRSDPEVDVLYRFASEPGSVTKYIQRRETDMEHEDCALDWPVDTPDSLITSEKLNMTLRTATYLQSITCMPKWIDIESDKSALVPRFATTHHDPMSPPLMPLSPFSDLKTNDVDESLLTSTPLDPSVNELEAFELETKRLDSLSFGELSDFDISKDSPGDHRSKVLIGTKRPRSENLKLEPPLLASYDLSPFKRQRLDLSDVLPLSPSGKYEAGYDQIFEELIDLAAPASHALQIESLQETDCAIRVPVPTLTEDTPRPPWLVFSKSGARHGSFKGEQELECQLRLLAEIKLHHLAMESSWRSTGDERLIWRPVPAKLESVDWSEVFHTDESVDRYLDEMHHNARISLDTLVWKAEGLRVLDAEDDDDDANEQVFYSDASQDHNSASFEAGWLDTLQLFVRADDNVEDQVFSAGRHGGLQQAHRTATTLGLFSASDALDAFMCVQTGVQSEL